MGLLESYIPADFGEIETVGLLSQVSVGLVIPVFGRPKYLKRCLKSLEASDLQDCLVCLVDESLAQTVPSGFDGFETWSGVDSPGCDFPNRRNLPLGELAAQARSEWSCCAFTSAGMLKSDLRCVPRPRSGSTVYIKNGFVPWLWRKLPTWWRANQVMGGKRANELVRNWAPKGFPVVKIFKHHHGNMFDSYRHAWRMLAEGLGCNLLACLDSDAIVRPDWLNRLRELHQRYQSQTSPLVVSGFHTNSHPTLVEEFDCRKKQSLGGINLMFHREIWPSMVETSLTHLGWDFELCQKVLENGGTLLATRPSVVQHLGRFGLWSHPLRYDRAPDF